jgi:hypothetical protein
MGKSVRLSLGLGIYLGEESMALLAHAAIIMTLVMKEAL